MSVYEFKVDESYSKAILSIHMEVDKINKDIPATSVSCSSKGDLLLVKMSSPLSKKELAVLGEIVKNKGQEKGVETASLSVATDTLSSGGKNYALIPGLCCKIKRAGVYLCDFSSVLSVSGKGQQCCLSFVVNESMAGGENTITPGAFSETTVSLKLLQEFKEGDAVMVQLRNKENATVTLKYRTLSALLIPP